MKRLLISLFLITCIGSLFADNNDSLDNYFQAEMLLEDDLFENFQEIQFHSQKISGTHKSRLFNQYKKDPLLPIAINLFTPFGIGSFIQGDKKGGFVQLGLDASAYGMIWGGYTMFIYGLSYSNDFPFPEVGAVVFVSGILTAATSAVYKIVRPIRYSENYNHTLRNALNNTEKVAMHFVPEIGFSDNGNLMPKFQFKISL